MLNFLAATQLFFVVHVSLLTRIWNHNFIPFLYKSDMDSEHSYLRFVLCYKLRLMKKQTLTLWFRQMCTSLQPILKLSLEYWVRKKAWFIFHCLLGITCTWCCKRPHLIFRLIWYVHPALVSCLFAVMPLANLHHFLIFALIFGCALWPAYYANPLFLMGISFDLCLFGLSPLLQGHM
jgi:hypothetical protein